LVGLWKSLLNGFTLGFLGWIIFSRVVFRRVLGF